MIQRMLASALFAGFAAGLLAALLHFSFVQNLLLLAEQYETGALVHFDTGADHGQGTGSDPAANAAAEGHSHAEGTAAHDHPAAGTGDPARNALSVLFMCLTYVAYGLMLVAGFALAERFGISIGTGDGVLWGIAGFATWQLAPALGLAPELPGTVAADLGARQVWWWGTVIATGAGLALLAYGRGFAAALIAGALLAAPHVIGAPEIEGFYGVAPPELGSAFAARVLGAALVSWAVLGWLSARLWSGKAV